MNFLGTILGIGCIVASMMMEGTSPGILLNIPAFLVVCGASFFACFIQYPLSAMGGAAKKFIWVLSPPHYNFAGQVELLISMSTTARQQGLLALENSVGSANDDFTRDGIQMIVDGVDKDAMSELMENAIGIEEEKDKLGVAFYEALGGYAPTMGIIGAVLGLIHAMSLLDRPDLLGTAVATAFVATVYGLVLANLIALPASGRIKAAIAEGTLYKTMTMEGLISIAAGENSMMLKRRMAVYTGEKEAQ
ncbi:MAG: flagellar motor protein [Succinivibrio sp.]|jgi:chemotaxis protein MotA|nr:flagellar motor protein [Succinivibrio sp.]